VKERVAVPIYEFVCQSCGNEFEQIQSFSDSSVPACTKCGSTDVVRRVGRPAIHFKGSGWYVTDSKKSNDKKSSGKSSGESTKSESTAESTSNGKVESKAETKSESATESKSESSSTKSAPAPVASD
jgi:putative FmdB family regulatory protein